MGSVLEMATVNTTVICKSVLCAIEVRGESYHTPGAYLYHFCFCFSSYLSCLPFFSLCFLAVTQNFLGHTAAVSSPYPYYGLCLAIFFHVDNSALAAHVE